MVDVVTVNAEEKPDPSLVQEEKQEETLYAGKYKSVEELEKGYLESQKLIGAKGLSQEGSPTSEDSTSSSSTTEESQSLEIPEKPEEVSQQNFDKYSEELQKDGSLSEASYSELEKQGFSKSMVDTYIKGQQASFNEKQQQVFDSVGGKEAYSDMVTWASGEFSVEEIDNFNEALNGTDYQRKTALADLSLRYSSANHRSPNLIDGKTSSGSTFGFSSLQAQAKAQADPRYKTDRDYRNEVEQRILASKY
jgi:hypothetical protein